MLIVASLQKSIEDALADGSKIKKAENGSPPLIDSSVAKALASAYDTYASKALAGALTISVPGQKSILEQAFKAPAFAGVTAGLLAYWTPVLWAGAGFIPANPTVPVALAGLSTPLSLLLKGPAPANMPLFASQLALLLHTYTSMLIVTATTTSTPPVVSPIPVT